MKITHRLATAADVDAFYGERPDKTLRAIVILMDGKPAALCGIAYGIEAAVAISEHKPELAPHLRTMPVLRAIKACQLLFGECRMPLLAVKECENNLLERLGFERLHDEVYQWAG